MLLYIFKLFSQIPWHIVQAIVKSVCTFICILYSLHAPFYCTVYWRLFLVTTLSFLQLMLFVSKFFVVLCYDFCGFPSLNCCIFKINKCSILFTGNFFLICLSINLLWGKKIGPDRFSRFDVHWIKTNIQTDTQVKYIYRLSW